MRHEKTDGGTTIDDEKWALGTRTLSPATLLLYLPFLINAVQALIQ